MAKYFTKAQLQSYEMVLLNDKPAPPCDDCTEYGKMDASEAPVAEWHIAQRDRRVCRWCAETWAQDYWSDERITDPDDVNQKIRLKFVQPTLRGTGSPSIAEMLSFPQGLTGRSTD